MKGAPYDDFQTELYIRAEAFVIMRWETYWWSALYQQARVLITVHCTP
jgi:hypothetical protein